MICVPAVNQRSDKNSDWHNKEKVKRRSGVNVGAEEVN